MAKPISFETPDTVAAVEAETSRTGNDYRALVCVFLLGGNDSHNMVIPRSGSANRIHYDLQRGTLAIAAGTELPLTAEWGINPNMPNFKSIYDSGKAGILMNVGVLAQPTTRAQYKSGTVKLPTQLYAHNSQQALWQSLPYLMQTPVNGYMGRADDLAGDFFNISAVDGINGVFSISGRPLQMQGYEAQSNDLTTSGPTSAYTSYASATSQYLGPARTRQEWNNKRQKMFADAVASSIAKQASINTNLQALPGSITAFTGLSTSSGNLGGQLAMVARLLLSRSNIGHRRDCFYVTISGWDDHDALSTAYGPRLAILDAALNAFWTALGQLGLQENVTLFTQSDFGRALKQNNDGSDHGWGGHALIMGGAVQGGQLFGTPPDFATGSVNDADQGRLIPTTSADQYVATLLKWWGVPTNKLELVLPNLANFPVKTLSFMEEPEPVVATPKAYSIDLNSALANGGSLPAEVVYSRSTTGVATQFDRDGNLICSPVNALPNSEFAGGEAFIGPIVSSTTNGWNVAAGSGLTGELLGVGVEDGMRYTEWRLKGTVTATNYSQVGFAPFPSSAGAMQCALGQSYTFFVKARRIAEKSPSPVNWSPNIRATTSAAGAVTGHDSTGPIGINPIYGSEVTDKPILLTHSINITDAAATRFVARVMLGGIAVGVYVEDTIRFYEPMVLPGIWERPPEYLPTTGTAKALPRLDHDPANGRVRGLLREFQRTNSIRNSIAAGGAAGFPGTLPTNWSLDPVAGLAVCVGTKKVVNNMTAVPIRVIGKASAAGNINISFDSHTVTTVVTNDDWIGSVFVTLEDGSLANISTSNLELIGYNSGVYVEATAKTLTPKKGKLSASRWYVGKQITNASVNQCRLQMRFTPVVGEYVDFTILVAMPQLEKGRQASSPIPTGPTGNAVNGAAGTRWGTEVCEVPVGPWFNASEGTLVARGESVPGEAGTRSSWPRLTGFSTVTGANSAYSQNQIGLYMLTSPDTSLNGRSGSSVINANVTSGDNSIGTPVIQNGKPGTRAISYSSGFLQTAHRGVSSTSAAPGALPTLSFLQIGMAYDAPVWVQSIDYYATKQDPTNTAVLTSG